MAAKRPTGSMNVLLVAQAVRQTADPILPQAVADLLPAATTHNEYRVMHKV